MTCQQWVMLWSWRNASASVPNKNNTMRLCYTRQSVEKITTLLCFRGKDFRNSNFLLNRLRWSGLWMSRDAWCMTSHLKSREVSEEFQSVLYLIKVLLLAFSGLYLWHQRKVCARLNKTCKCIRFMIASNVSVFLINRVQIQSCIKRWALHKTGTWKISAASSLSHMCALDIRAHQVSSTSQGYYSSPKINLFDTWNKMYLN